LLGGPIAAAAFAFHGHPGPGTAHPAAFQVDDFAIKCGQNYVATLVECEGGAPLERLDVRDGKPLADCLSAHSGAEVICRDRSGVS
jgi:hypothetical protein